MALTKSKVKEKVVVKVLKKKNQIPLLSRKWLLLTLLWFLAKRCWNLKPSVPILQMMTVLPVYKRDLQMRRWWPLPWRSQWKRFRGAGHSGRKWFFRRFARKFTNDAVLVLFVSFVVKRVPVSFIIVFNRRPKFRGIKLENDGCNLEQRRRSHFPPRLQILTGPAKLVSSFPKGSRWPLCFRWPNPECFHFAVASLFHDLWFF